MGKALRQFRGFTGRICRDLRRHLQDTPEGALREKALEALWRVGRLLEQARRARTRSTPRHALHEPEVDCISKSKARIRCEFGTKVSLAATLDGGFVVGARSFPGNPYDGHTLAPHWSRLPS
jgi:IS5 family transposase